MTLDFNDGNHTTTVNHQQQMKLRATVNLVLVTVEMAVEWLSDKWRDQRTVRAGHVNRLASDMLADRFKISPDAILRIKGKLANGQHRLSAVVQSGKPQWFIVLESDDDELYKVIDAGLKRTVADGLIGLPYAKEIPPIARWVQSYDKQTVRPTSRTGAEAHAGMSNRLFPSQCENIDYCLENREILSEAAGFVNTLYKQTKLLNPSIAGALYVIGSQKNGTLEKTKQFLQDVYVDGGRSAAGDFRNRLITDKGCKARLSKGYIFGIALKALKSYINGTRPGVLKWAKEDQFPTL